MCRVSSFQANTLWSRIELVWFSGPSSARCRRRNGGGPSALKMSQHVLAGTTGRSVTGGLMGG